MTSTKAKAQRSPKKQAPKSARAKSGSSQQSAAMRRSLFVEALLSNGENITEAALAAGFSPKSAATQGSRLFKHAKVQQELNTRRAQLLGDAQLTTKRVHESVAQALFFDPRKLYREDGTLKPIHELDDDTAMALAGLEIVEEYGPATDTELEPQPHGGGLKRSHGRKVVTGYTAKVKWLDKNAARDQAAKMLGLYNADNRQRVDPLADLLTQLMQRHSTLPVVEEA